MKQKFWNNISSACNFFQLNRALSVILVLVYGTSVSSNTILPSQDRHMTVVASPVVEFTFVPPYGSSENLHGRVRNVDLNHQVAVYIFVEGSGWWTKPTFAQPLTPIQSDSTWVCDITTGGNDAYATKIHAFLLPNGVNPPQAGGLPDLPPSLFTISVANVSTMRSPKTISFSGYEWWVKASAVPVGPGPNYFSDGTENVWVDSLGQLHLKITQRNGQWRCAEVVLKNSLGYGRYVFSLKGKVGQLNPNVVLGLFTWDNASVEFHREIDIEFSRWGEPTDPNAQYVIQPWDHSGNRERWMIPTSLDFSTHSFLWAPDSIYFLSMKGHQSFASSDSMIYSWLYIGPNVPSRGNENARINFWLFNGHPPSDNTEAEVVITKFEYNDLSTSAGEDYGLTPTEYFLSQNYPNPFNPSTTIHFEVPKLSQLTIKIYDLRGRDVCTLSDYKFPAGKFVETWDGRDNRQLPVASGVYLMRMQAEKFIRVKKLVLLR